MQMNLSRDFSGEQAERIDKFGKERIYKPPKHSAAFLEHLNEVKNAWPCEKTSDDAIPDDNNDMQSDSTGYGVYCTGEPSIDPSRQVQSILDGESDWI